VRVAVIDVSLDVASADTANHSNVSGQIAAPRSAKETTALERKRRRIHRPMATATNTPRTK